VLVAQQMPNPDSLTRNLRITRFFLKSCANLASLFPDAFVSRATKFKDLFVSMLAFVHFRVFETVEFLFVNLLLVCAGFLQSRQA
jgi:hypothetical protein